MCRDSTVQSSTHYSFIIVRGAGTDTHGHGHFAFSVEIVLEEMSQF